MRSPSASASASGSQHDGATPLPPTVPSASASKGRHCPSGETGSPGCVPVAGDLRHVHATPPARAMSHSPASRRGRQVHRDQRGGAGGLHGHRRARQPEPVGDPGGQEVGLVAQAPRRSWWPGRPATAGGELVTQVGVVRVQVHPAARVHADPRPAGRRVAAGVLERVVAGLQEQPVLRVEQLGLARADAEEAGVEAGRRRPGRRWPPRSRGATRPPSGTPAAAQFPRVKKRTLSTPASRFPVLVDGGGAREPGGHADRSRSAGPPGVPASAPGRSGGAGAGRRGAR